MAKLFAGLVALGTAAFGLFGATTGDLALLLRNKWELTLAALICGSLLILFTAVAALRPKQTLWRFCFGVCFLLAVGVVGCLFTAKILVQDERVRPTVTAEWEMVGSNAAVKITTEADDVAETHVLWVAVTSGETTVYSGTTGPDVDGKAKQTAKVIVPDAVKESGEKEAGKKEAEKGAEKKEAEKGPAKAAVMIAAAIVEKDDSPVDGGEPVSCFGSRTTIQPASPAPSVTPDPDAKSVEAACITLTTAPTSSPTPTAS
ncbi:hypothetical protein [Streptomyces chryseus]|uniref:hypothetical protein n=1 Tax=Streptomyces chryseus TaxID=68186 RepID=UPI00110FB6EB|nr:hypothetical protein [Streptomyces chryseus]GGX36766.1 hypothetical protein GCM10010353_59930 [Streptomyces chryseus]